VGSARDNEDPDAGHGYVPKLILAGRLAGTFDGRPVVISADEAGVFLDVSTLYSGWQLRKYSSSVLPVLGWLNYFHVPLTVRVAGVVSVPVLPKAGLLVRFFAPSLANGC
jgi:hypothetical protein